ncbi:hypothetical protein HDF13_003858 [Edaphobacter lichenicola]|uniref:Uncharacterized protein n=1 Tax=Tunturiibacter gelidiferens TaxID=3069689 RepID=A0ACC5P484_9BACT|nr:hypothetical protein [Edaphobacter lichenicola]
MNGTMLDGYQFLGVESGTCHFLPANFIRPNSLYGHTYFATFTGRVVGTIRR